MSAWENPIANRTIDTLLKYQQDKDKLVYEGGSLVLAPGGDAKSSDDHHIHIAINYLLEWMVITSTDPNASIQDRDAIRIAIQPGGELDQVVNKIDFIANGLRATSPMMEGYFKEYRQDVETIRQMSLEKEEIAFVNQLSWVRKTAPELLPSLRRVAFAIQASQDETVSKIIKKAMAPNQVKGCSSTCFFITTPYVDRYDELTVTPASPLVFLPDLFAKPLSGQVGVKQDRQRRKLPRAGINVGECLIRERLAYTIQNAIGIDFGAPPVVLVDLNFPQFGDDNPFVCFQEYISDSRDLFDVSDKEVEEIPVYEVAKCLLKTIVFDADGHISNYLFKDNKIIPIDHGLALPRPMPDEYFMGLRQTRNQLISFPQAYEKVPEEMRAQFVSMDIDKVMDVVKADVEAHVEKFGEEYCGMPQECLNILRLNLNLVKIGCEMNKSIRDIVSVQVPLRLNVDKQSYFLGGEITELYENYIHEKTPISWERIQGEIRKVLGKKVIDRLHHDRLWVYPDKL